SMGFTVIPIAVIAGWVTRTFGLRVVVSLGCLLQAAAFAVLHQAGMHTSYTVLFGTTLVIGAGLGLNMAPCTAAIITSVSEAKQGVAASVNHATREIGTALGVALFGGLLTGVYASHIHRASAHLPAAARAISRESIAGALAVAHQTAQHAHTAARALTHAHPFGRHHVHLVAIGHAHAHALAPIGR